MDLERLEKRGLIDKARYSEKQINANLNRARRDLVTAKANLEIDEEWSYAIAYHAMLRAGRALMFAIGYRPRGKDQHKTVVDFCAEILARIMHETPSRDRGDGRATGQPQGLGSEAYLFRTPQGSRPEDAREDGQIPGRSRWLVHNAGQGRSFGILPQGSTGCE